MALSGPYMLLSRLVAWPSSTIMWPVLMSFAMLATLLCFCHIVAALDYCNGTWNVVDQKVRCRTKKHSSSCSHSSTTNDDKIGLAHGYLFQQDFFIRNSSLGEKYSVLCPLKDSLIYCFDLVREGHEQFLNFIGDFFFAFVVPNFNRWLSPAIIHVSSYEIVPMVIVQMCNVFWMNAFLLFRKIVRGSCAHFLEEHCMHKGDLKCDANLGWEKLNISAMNEKSTRSFGSIICLEKTWIIWRLKLIWTSTSCNATNTSCHRITTTRVHVVSAVTQAMLLRLFLFWRRCTCGGKGQHKWKPFCCCGLMYLRQRTRFWIQVQRTTPPSSSRAWFPRPRQVFPC